MRTRATNSGRRGRPRSRWRERGHRLLLPAALALLGGLPAGCRSPGPLLLSSSRKVTSPEGWRGNRYLQNGLTVSEEFDAVGGDGRIDLWRYFDRGRILAEEWDANQDDRVDMRVAFSPLSGEVREVKRDSDFDGTYDIKVSYFGGYLWRQDWDRNRDGKVDFVLYLNGPSRLLTELKAHRVRFTDLRRLAPRKYWREVLLDDDFDHRFDHWTRYAPDGRVFVGSDTNADGKPDNWTVREPAAKATEAETETAPPAPRPGRAAGPRSGTGHSRITAVQPDPRSGKDEKNNPPRVRVKVRVLE